MKKFKDLIEEVLEEGSYRYPGDDMTQKELKIAVNAAKNILDMIEDGATVQRWQISAIVKASEELASVCTSMRADEEDEDSDDWEDDYEDEEPIYVGFEYPSMYGEEVELDETKFDIKKLPGYKKTVKNSVGNIIHHFNDGSKVYSAYGQSSSGRKLQHYKITKNGEREIHSQTSLKKSFMQEEVELDESLNDIVWNKNVIKPGTKRTLTKKYKPGDKVKYGGGHSTVVSHDDKGFVTLSNPKWSKNRIVPHTSIKEELDFKVSVDGLPDMYVKGNSPSEVKTNLRKVIKKPDSIQSVDRVTKAMLKKIFRDKAMGKEEIEEGYNESVHRKYISDVVHEYVPKDDDRHEKIVDHLHKAKNYGSKTADSLESHAGISIGAAKRITKAVSEHMKANFGAPGKPQTQAQRVNSYLKQKWVKPR